MRSKRYRNLRSLMITKIKKRDGRIVNFDPSRIADAIHRAFTAVELKNGKRAKHATEVVVQVLEEEFQKRIPSVEDVQNVVVVTLKKMGYAKVSDEYQAYREKKREIRRLKESFGIKEPKVTVNAWEVLTKRYLLRNDGGTLETPTQMFMRVAEAIAKVDKKHGQNMEQSEKIFFRMMTRLEFLPNSPTLFSAGTGHEQLSACFVLPIEDSLTSIFTAVKNMALIEQSGGGVGFNFSDLRPRNDIVRSSRGVASGPVSFMHVFNVATEVIRAGGKRRGAMMGILRVDHPDIIEFITSKEKPGILPNFNISVAVTDDFMETIQDGKYWVINPRNSARLRMLNANDIWNLLARSAWRSGDPGVIFLDEINKHNPIPEIGRIYATNPCGEQPLLPYESCNLGSIDLSKIVENRGIDWKKLERTVRNAVHFLDNVIDANKFSLKEIEEITKANRKIGLGVMGFADMLIKLEIPYNSMKALKLGERIMRFITEEGRKKSVELGEKRGSFPNFDKTRLKDKWSAMRNATVTTIAPTGSISIIAGCSSGIEPLFAVSFIRNVLDGTRLLEINPLFEIMAKHKGFYNASLFEEIARSGSIQGINGISERISRIFVTALDISPDWHIRMQAAFQKYTDNAVSKTVNLPSDASVEDVVRVFELAWKLKCKGVTVFRYGCRPEQVLYLGKIGSKKSEFVVAESVYSGGCPSKTCNVLD